MGACVVAMARNRNDALVALAAEHQDTLMVVLGDMYVLLLMCHTIYIDTISLHRVDPKTSQEAVHTAIQQWVHLDSIVLNAGVLDPTGKFDSIPVSSEGVTSEPNVQAVVSPVHRPQAFVEEPIRHQFLFPDSYHSSLSPGAQKVKQRREDHNG
jgi:hypothetical protein